MNNTLEHQKAFWLKSGWLVVEALILFALALTVQHFAYNYVDFHAQTTHVGDLLLDHLPSVNLDIFIVQGALVLTGLLIILLLVHPRYILFSIKALSLFIITRSIFISLTHLGVNLHQITLNTNSIGFSVYDFLYNGKNDFFFSGHVGATFLMALIFWREKIWRYTFLVCTGIFAVSVILAHMHYSIDVFAAPFITYALFEISKKIFKADYQLIHD